MERDDEQGGKTSEREEAPGALAKRLMTEARRGTLATALARDGSGWPYASLVLVAPDERGEPRLLLSDLSDHAQNLKADRRCSLLIDGTGARKDPLTGPRLTLLGEAEPDEDEAAEKTRFIEMHPGAKAYADFTDFHVYRLRVARAHLVAGFGRIHWMARGELPGFSG